MPIGAIIGGLPYAEDRLLALAGACQATTGWHLERPADPARPPRREPWPPVRG
jgi:Asp-tRNA(Asn)/Glu-tRNA(Gln) amidotransferase A subunit family amidase